MDTKIEKRILELFLFDNNLKFNEIEKQIKIRSNKLAYHIKNLVKKGILIKDNENYLLSEAAEHLIPYLSDKKAVLPVVLVHIGNKNKCFLYDRQKRPFRNYLSLPGGRFLVNESIPEATRRLMKKFNINASFSKINSISLEHVKKNKSKIHSFLLVFVTATTKDKIILVDINRNKSKIIKSDYELLKNDLDKEIRINTLYSKS
jgi:ADP-ribose pyrophosphatase YjhB (NUDIX family)